MTNQRLSDLQEAIKNANNAYYNGSQSLLSDAEYDILKSELASLDPENSLLTSIGADVSTVRKKMSHLIPMGSLDNTDDGILGVGSWCDTIKQDFKIFASFKIDGASVCANYKDGKLVSVLTRGNGEIGEVITANALKFINLPQQLSQKITASVRGEAILYKADFDKICEDEGIPVEERSNPRNVGNGILGRDDGRNSDRMRFLAFNIECIGQYQTEDEKFKFIETLGFDTAPHKLCETRQQFEMFYNEVLERRTDLEYEIDGIVICVNEIDIQKQYITADIKSRLRPKFARAVKFPHKSNTTKLIGVNLSVGHTGLIAPTAILDTVRVGGVNVTNVLLNNWDEISRLGVQIGDTVEVVLAGDIIPKIVRVVKQADSDRTPIKEPTQCPVCGSHASRVLRGKEGANTFCTSIDCKAKKLGKIDHWIGSSKKGVGILGIGSTILEALCAKGLVEDPADLYTLKVEDFEDLLLDGVRVGRSRAQMIVNNIAEKKELSLDTFLGALGIDLLGSRRVQILQKAANGRLDTLDNWLDSDLLEMIALPGFGDAIRDAVIEGIAENAELIRKLLNVGVVIKSNTKPQSAVIKESSDTDNQIAGKSFCFTGTRKYLPEVEAMGGIIKSGVSKGLDYLVQLDPLSMSSKSKKAEEYGTKIISVDFLGKMLEGADQY